MPFVDLDGVNIFYEETGHSGDPLVLVHGSWGDHHNWDAVVPDLAKSFRVLTYDRRGHSQSECPPGQGSIRDDVRDLALLIERLDLAPAHIIGNSGGAAVVLRLAAERPDLFRTMSVHEPPLFALLAGVPEAQPGVAEFERRIGPVVQLLERSEWEGAARQFVETIAFGPGAWETLPAETRQTFVKNARTFLDETHDPESLQLDTSTLQRFTAPALLTRGTTSAPFFPFVVQRIAAALPGAEQYVHEGAGHVPHLSHPAEFVRTIRDWVAKSA